jgi:ribosomal protein S18 acetylase RimI-like enzyme
MSSKIQPSSPLSSRLYKTEHDLRAMLGMLMQARTLTNDWHYSHVGELLWNFFMVDCHLDPLQHIRLWHDTQGRLVAYAILGEDPSFDCQVLPEYEWTGIEIDAYNWAMGFLSELREHYADRWDGALVSGARQDDERRIHFLEERGFHYSGRFAEVNMLRSLSEPIPSLLLPTSCQVRELGLDEISDRAAAQRDVWQPWTVGNVSADNYVRFMKLPGYHRDLDIVSIAPDGFIAAYVNGWIDPVNRFGDFGPVGARQEYRRQGFTRLALLEGLRRMKAYGMDRVCISTGLSNTPALNLYASIGFKIVNKYLDYVQSG